MMGLNSCWRLPLMQEDSQSQHVPEYLACDACKAVVTQVHRTGSVDLQYNADQLHVLPHMSHCVCAHRRSGSLLGLRTIPRYDDHPDMLDDGLVSMHCLVGCHVCCDGHF
jgi:hypothetical protein